MSMATSIKAQNTAGPARHIFWLTLLLSFCLTGCAGSANTGKYYDRDGPPGLTGTLNRKSPTNGPTAPTPSWGSAFIR